jgi:phosphoribosyl 1,2-cyclic phosphate phosphodiesterase
MRLQSESYNLQMEVVFMGTGTSQGIPVIGCNCEVCTSTDSRDKRLRSSVLVVINDFRILIDVSPDFRIQMIENNEQDLDIILLTHEHNDHIIGMDDVRPINFKYGKNIPVYGLPRVLDQVRLRFEYAFSEDSYPGAPKLTCHNLTVRKPFKPEKFNLDILPLDVEHGNLSILGFKILNFAYITDASRLSDSTMEALMNLDVLVINALQKTTHFSHFSLPEALEVIHKLKPKRTYLTHLSHHLGQHQNLMVDLPENVWPAYDKLRIRI